MLMVIVSLAVAGLLGVDSGEPPPTTPTTIPDSPAAGLSLQAGPVAPDRAPSRPHGSVPSPATPGGRTTLAAMVAGMALLAGRARRISNAERTIRASLQDSLFSDVNHEDLAGIADVIRDLDAGEASAVIAGLSDGELGVWMRELDGWMGGFSPEEQAGLFRDLATRLNPVQLQRLMMVSDKKELVEATIAGSPPAVRGRLAMLLWTSQNPTDRGWGGIVGLLSGVPAPVLEAGMGHMPLESLVEGLLGRHEVRPNGDPRLRLDAMAHVIGRAAQFDDPGLKGRIFVEIAQQALAHRSIPTVGDVGFEEVIGGLTSLLRSDLGPIIGGLNHDIDPHGNVLSEWIREMIEADRIDQLDVLLAGLIGGGRRLDHFTEPGSDPAFPFPNAANLGYYIGAYSLAIDAIAEDATDRVNLVERLFSIVTGIVPGPGGSRVRLPFGPLVDAHAASVVDGLREDASSLKQTLWGLAKPRTRTGLRWNGVGTTQFQDAWEEVVLVR